VFQALQVRDFRLLWVAGMVSSIGSWLLVLAVPAHVFLVTGSLRATGLILAAEYLPLLILSPVAGVLADRWDRRRVMIVTDLFRMVAVASMLLGVPAARYWVCYLAVFAESSGTALFQPALRARVPDMVGTGSRLASANTLTAVGAGVVRLAGGPLGGILLAVIGFRALICADAASYLVSAVALGFTAQRGRLAGRPGSDRPVGGGPAAGDGTLVDRVQAAGRRPAAGRGADRRTSLAGSASGRNLSRTCSGPSGRSPHAGAGRLAAPGRVLRAVASELRGGLFVLRGEPSARALLPVTVLFLAANASLSAVLIPFGVQRLGGSQPTGILFAGLGAGFLLSAPVLRGLLDRVPARWLLAGTLTASAASYWLLFHSASLRQAVPAAVAVGMSGSMSLVIAQTTVQRVIPGASLGRVTSVFLAGEAAATLAGAVLGPALASGLRIGGAADTASLVTLLAALTAFLLIPGRPQAELADAAGP
jgi:MFS family permease